MTERPGKTFKSEKVDLGKEGEGRMKRKLRGCRVTRAVCLWTEDAATYV